MKRAVTTLWIICCCVTGAAIAEKYPDIWSEASPDKSLVATIRFVPNPDKNWRAFDELKITVFRRGRDGKPGQILASTDIGGRFLQCAHWSPDSQFLLFTTSLARGAHGGWHFAPFVYCAADHSFRSGLEDKSGDVVAAEFRFDSPDIAVLTILDKDAPSPSTEEMPSKEVKVSLSKISPALERDDSEETVAPGTTASGALTQDAATDFAEKEIHAISARDTDVLISLYADYVDLLDKGVVSRDIVRKNIRQYFDRWPIIKWKMTGPISVEPLEASRYQLTFPVTFDVTDPNTNRRVTGTANEKRIVVIDSTGSAKIVLQREKVTHSRKVENRDGSSKRPSR